MTTTRKGKGPRRAPAPSFKIALRFPNGCGMSCESLKDIEWTPDSWCVAAIEHLADYLEHVREYRATLSKKVGQ